MYGIKTVIDVTKQQIESILAFEQCRITLPDEDNLLNINIGDNIVFIHDNKIACATITNKSCEHIQDIGYGDIYDEGIRVDIPDVLSKKQEKPLEYDSWTKEHKDKYITDLAKATYIAQCTLRERLESAYKEYWDSIIINQNFKKLKYDANPVVKVLNFEVM